MDLDELLAPSRALGAQWSVSVQLDGAPFAEHRSTSLLRTASVAKVFVLLEVAERLSDGSLDEYAAVDRRTTVPVGDSGLWQAFTADRLSVADAAVLVGAVSDNWATNALIDVCGLTAIQARAALIAPGGSMLHDHLRDERGEGHPATVSTGCAADWASIMHGLLRADDPAARLVCRWLARDTDLSMVAAAFDLDPLAHENDDLGLRLSHKTGTDPGVRADVGLVRSATAVVSYAAICNWPASDLRPDTRRTVLSTMRSIGDEISRTLAVAP